MSCRGNWLLFVVPCMFFRIYRNYQIMWRQVVEICHLFHLLRSSNSSRFTTKFFSRVTLLAVPGRWEDLRTSSFVVTHSSLLVNQYLSLCQVEYIRSTVEYIRCWKIHGRDMIKTIESRLRFSLLLWSFFDVCFAQAYLNQVYFCFPSGRDDLYLGKSSGGRFACSVWWWISWHGPSHQ